MSVNASFEDKMKELEQIAHEAEKKITILIEDNGKLEENKYETQEEN